MPRIDIADDEFIEEPKDPFAPFIPKVCTMASITDNGNADILTLAQFISAKATDSGRRSAFASVENASTCLNVNSDDVLVQAYPTDGASQQVRPASLRTFLLHLCRYSHSVDHPGERQMYYAMRKALFWPNVPNEFYVMTRYRRSFAQNPTHGKWERQ